MHTDSEATNEPSERSTLKTQIYRRLNAQVDTKWGDLILLGCFYCSGLVDSMAFNMYGCFVSMQTGTLNNHEARRKFTQID
jgi:hypothetical protein